MNGSPQASIPPEIPKGLREGIDRAGKHWPNVRLAHEGVMIDKIQRQARIAEIASQLQAGG